MNISPGLAAPVGGALLRTLFATVRWRTFGEEHLRARSEPTCPVIFVLWHGRLLCPTYHHRGQGIAALISRNRDGEHIARLVERWGYRTVRGSSSRGASTATRGLLEALANGHSLAVTPDGPRGPRQRMKPGALHLARASGAPLVPVTASARGAWWFGTWDRFMVPRPGTEVHVHYGPAICVPPDVGSEAFGARSTELEQRLNRMTTEADAIW